MKRSKEVSIIIDALVQAGLINDDKLVSAKRAVGDGLKEIRRRKFEANRDSKRQYAKRKMLATKAKEG